MNLLTIFILSSIIAAGIVFRKTIKRALFAVLWAYANHWNQWIGKVEKEHIMMQRRNVLTRRD